MTVVLIPQISSESSEVAKYIITVFFTLVVITDRGMIQEAIARR